MDKKEVCKMVPYFRGQFQGRPQGNALAGSSALKGPSGSIIKRFLLTLSVTELTKFVTLLWVKDFPIFPEYMIYEALGRKGLFGVRQKNQFHPGIKNA